MAESDVAHGLTLRFRHLAGELRRASGHPNADREFERLLLRVSGALRDAFYTRRLPGLILDACDQEKSSGLNLFWEFQMAFSVVGYWEPYEFVEPDWEADDGEYVVGDRAVFLRPGPISLAWPGVFDSILCEDRLSNDADVQAIFGTALVEQQFTIMGYYATACDLLADWIEARSVAEPEVAVSADPSADALSAVVAGGLAGVLQAAVGARSVDRVTAIIRERVAADFRLYDRRADDWAAELRTTKKTVTDSTGWREIMQWRAANKTDRVSKKTGK